MKQTVLPSTIGILTIAATLFVPRLVHATTVINDVNSTSDGGNASSHVSIHNSVNTSSTTQSTVTNGRTHIRIETNGKVKEYNSDKPGDVTIQSDDGTSRVHVNTTSGGNSASVTQENDPEVTEQNDQNSDSDKDKDPATVKEEAKNAREEIKRDTKDTVKDARAEGFDIRKFIAAELAFIKNLFVKFF